MSNYKKPNSCISFNNGTIANYRQIKGTFEQDSSNNLIVLIVFQNLLTTLIIKLKPHVNAYFGQDNFQL